MLSHVLKKVLYRKVKPAIEAVILLRFKKVHSSLSILNSN